MTKTNRSNAASPSARTNAGKKGANVIRKGSSRTVINMTADDCAVPKAERHQMISEAAYFLAEQRGFVPGFEELDWLQAEKSLMKHFHSKV